MHLSGPDSQARLALVLSLSLVAPVAGCGGYQWARISMPGTHRAAAVQLHASRDGGRSELQLLHAALQMAGVYGSHRLACDAVSGLQSAEGRAGGIKVDLVRSDGLGGEQWVVSRMWAMRQLGNGARVAWQGQFDQILDTIALLGPVEEPVSR